MDKKQTTRKKLLALICSMVLCLLLLPAARAEETMASEETEGVIPASGTLYMITLEDGSQVPGYTFQCERQSELPTAEHLATAATEQLIEELLESSFNTYHIFCNSQDLYEKLVRTNPYVQELLSRDGSVIALLAYYEGHSDLDYIPRSALESLIRSSTVQETATSLEREEMVKLNLTTKQENMLGSFATYNGFAEMFGIGYSNSSGYVLTTGYAYVSYKQAERAYTANEQKFVSDYFAEVYPEAIEKGPGDSRYNCHSYAWYWQSTSNPYWIERVDTFVDDAHTVESNTPAVGKIVVYKDADGDRVHSGVVSQKKSDGTVMVTSKWGDGMLCEHKLDYVPETYYYDKSTKSVDVDYYSISKHSYKVTGKTASNHKYTCSICKHSYTERHILNTVGVCKICNYSGPVIADRIHPEQPALRRSLFILQ